MLCGVNHIQHCHPSSIIIIRWGKLNSLLSQRFPFCIQAGSNYSYYWYSELVDDSACHAFQLESSRLGRGDTVYLQYRNVKYEKL